MENDVVAVHIGFLQEEIAGMLYGNIREFHNDVFEVIDKLEEKPGARLFMMNNYLKPGAIVPSWLTVITCSSADDFVKQYCDDDWEIFKDYDKRDSDSYFAIQSLKTYSFEERIEEIKDCLCLISLHEHVKRGKHFAEKGMLLAKTAAEHGHCFKETGISFTSLGATSEINYTHDALWKQYPETIISVVHYWRKNPNTEELHNKWSVRTSIDNKENVNNMMITLCGEGNFGGTVGSMPDVSGVRGYYQAGGTGIIGYEEFFRNTVR